MPAIRFPSPLNRTVYLGALIVLAAFPLYLNSQYLSVTYSASSTYAVEQVHDAGHDYHAPDVLADKTWEEDHEDPFHDADDVVNLLPHEDDSDENTPDGMTESNPVSKAFLSMAVFMVAMLEWSRPGFRHWPPYEVYGDSRYDPNRWEGFERETGYYLGSGTKRLPKKYQDDPQPYFPFPDYNGEYWRRHWKGDFAVCQGPRGISLDKSPSDQVFVYQRPSRLFPNPSIGSLENLGMSSDICFDRQSRYGAYGLTDGDPSQAMPAREPADWDRVDWGNLQDKCLLRNKNRYYPRAWKTLRLTPGIELPDDFAEATPDEPTIRFPSPREAKYHPRTAILIRSFEGYDYTENDIQAIRAVITELSLFPGGEYTVFLLVQIKSTDQYDIYNNPNDYQQALNDHVPAELRPITLLWTEEMCEKAYPEVGNWNVYFQQWMPVQWFAATHPEFDFFWNWETDVRYTGHHYDFLEEVADFARNQRRRFLWERNKRYWIPSVHGDYEKWYSDTNAKIEAAARDGRIEPPVWGPQPYHPDQKPLGPEPPSPGGTYANTWGVGEEADLITLLPIWDPRNTDWSFRNQIWNFVDDVAPEPNDIFVDLGFDNPEFKNIPRRVSISTVSRVSRPLLRAMHLENKAGRSMQAEMWPTTVALHHGFKAVYAPQPIWWDRKWPALYADAVFNAHSEDDYDGHDVPPGVFPDLTKQATEGDNGIKSQSSKNEALRSGERLTTHWKRGDDIDEDEDEDSSNYSHPMLDGFAFLRNAFSSSSTKDSADSSYAHGPVQSGDSREDDRYRESYNPKHPRPADDPNAGTANPVQWSECSDSPYNHDREWNFAGWSWYYRSSFGGTLYRRFLGLRTPEVHDTGEAYETMSDEVLAPGRLGEAEDVYGGREWEGEQGRICLPGMLLHPIKKVVEHLDTENLEGHAIEIIEPARIVENPIPQWRR